MIDPDLSTDYDARATVSAEQFDDIMAAYRHRSDAAVAGLPGSTGIVYDRRSGQRLDIWGIGPEPRPVFFVVHGGYWRALSRFDTAFMAASLAADGIATVVVDYGLAPATDLAEIIRQVRAALTWTYRHGGEHGLDVGRIVVGGSSAGAHLAAATMVGGWQSAAGIPEDTVSGGLLLSGLFDLRPLVRTTANEWLHLTESSAAEASPALCTPPSTPIVIAVAEHEAPGFHWQSRDLLSRWSAGSDSPLLTVPGRNHFDVFLDLADSATAVSQAARGLVAGTAPGTAPHPIP